MEIFLDNIGLIQNSTVKLDGLTVIAGENNSGKSTVAKTLYAITDGMIDIDLKQEQDELNYCRIYLLKKLKKHILNTLRLSTSVYHELILKTDIEKTAIDELLSRDFEEKFDTKESILSIVEYIIEEIKHLKINYDNDDTSEKLTNNKKEIVFNELKNNIYGTCQEIINLLENGTNKIDFRIKHLHYMLINELNEEIHPVKNREVTSKISITDDFGIFFDCTIKNVEILEENFLAVPLIFSNSYFIDNVFLLDQVHTIKYNKLTPLTINNEKVTIDIRSILNHAEKLTRYLATPISHNITHEIEINEKYRKIKEQIKNILPGEFKNTPQGLKYEHEGISLKAVNLATGSKMFAIIKMILDRYGFNDTTLLILDEPEAHLHPKWQNAFAEVIVLLVKELGVRVLLASHSAHFVLALDAQMRKYEINDKTNFYKTCIQEDGFVHYELVNDDLTVIYDDFATYYAVSKYIRDSKYYGENE